ncbi:MAG: FtsQ-type POTRA domain-containing protein [Deltaproteobacteria bacterium]|nr:FtsQ-type POTRA domain-containing protein [Deltaproteobacteria bacterium]
MAVSHARKARMALPIRSSNAYRSRPDVSVVKAIGALFAFVAKAALFFILVAGISLGLLYSYRWMTTSQIFALQTIRISGNHHLRIDQVEAIAGLSRGENLLDQSVRTLQGRLMADPWVAEASVRRILPDTLIIEVKERAPAFWIRDGKTLAYADDRGRVIDRIVPGGFYSLPLLEQDPGAEDETIRRVLNMFEARAMPCTLREVTLIRNAPGGFVHLFLGEAGPWIVVDTTNAARGNRALSAVWQDLRARGELDMVAEVMALGDKVWVKFKENEV